MAKPIRNCREGFDLWQDWYSAFVDGNRLTDEYRKAWLKHVEACTQCTYERRYNDVLDTHPDTDSD